MKISRFSKLVFLANLSLLCTRVSAAQPQIRLLGLTSIAANSSDKLPQSGTLENGQSQQLFGGISGIEYIGNDDYLLISDRGPQDGGCHYLSRFHRIKLAIDNNAGIQLQLENTIPLVSEENIPYNGFLGEFTPGDHDHSIRRDDEAIRLMNSEQIIVADEYGPEIDIFDFHGHCRGHFQIPPIFRIENESADPLFEVSHNDCGRQPNCGLESLAITPSGDKILSMVQRPLIQDSVPTAEPNIRSGINCRIVQFNRQGIAEKQFDYQLEADAFATSEILAIDEDRFLVIERDSKPAEISKLKRLYQIDISQASDVSSIECLADPIAVQKVTPVSKEMFLDFLSPESGLELSQVGAKLEGITFGPKLATGERTLIVASDNDFLPESPTWFYVYAIADGE